MHVHHFAVEGFDHISTQFPSRSRNGRKLNYNLGCYCCICLHHRQEVCVRQCVFKDQWRRDHVHCDVYMLPTGLQMRTASSPVISRAQSKPRLHKGKRSPHRDTGVLLDSVRTSSSQAKNHHGLKTVFRVNKQ